MGPARNEMRDVELVEVDAAELGAPAWDGPAAAEDDLRRPAPRRLRRSWVAGAVGVLVLGGVTGTLVGEQRERTRLAALADVPGVLRPLDGPVAERWRTEMPLWIELTEVSGLLVGVTDVRGPERPVEVVGIDAATGETAWRTAVATQGTLPRGGLQCTVPAAGEGADERDRLVVCLVVEALGPSAYDRGQYEPLRSRVLVLESSTGDVVADRPVDPTTSLTALGPDVVVKDRAPGGRVRVTRTDPLGEQERWAFTGPPVRGPHEYTPVRVDDDLVVVPGEAGWVLTPEGEVVESWTPGRPLSAGWAEVLGGRTLVRPVRDSLGASTVTDLVTGEEFAADAYPLQGVTDDGSAGELALLQSSAGKGLTAFEPSGEVRWTADGPDAGGLVVVGGRVVRVHDDLMEALDASTGEMVWRTSVPSASQYGLRTDGRVVLRAEPDADGDDVVVARRLDDGRVEWTADVPDDVQHVFTVAGRLYGYTPDGLVALRDAGA